MKKNLPFSFAKPATHVPNNFSPIFKGLALGFITSLGLSEQALAQTPAQVIWPFKRNAQDSTAARLGGLTATSATLRRLVVSDGSTPSSGTLATPYSANRGQAFAPAADGSGWPTSSAVVGPGSNPRRTHYEQFAITATRRTRLDSLLFVALATSSPGGRVAAMYSLSNFVADSANMTAGNGPGYASYMSGTTTIPGAAPGPLPSGANGSFPATGSIATTSAVLQPLVGNTGGAFRFELNGPTGVVLNPNQTLTVRLYFTINNSTPGRYILLRDVVVKGQQLATSVTTSRAKDQLAVYPNPAQNRLTIAHAAAQRGASVVIYSATGQRVAVVAPQAGSVRTEVHLEALASGIYLVEYVDGQQRTTARVVKQ